MGCFPLNARAFASPDSTMPITSAGFDAIISSDFDTSALIISPSSLKATYFNSNPACCDRSSAMMKSMLMVAMPPIGRDFSLAAATNSSMES